MFIYRAQKNLRLTAICSYKQSAIYRLGLNNHHAPVLKTQCMGYNLAAKEFRRSFQPF